MKLRFIAVLSGIGLLAACTSIELFGPKNPHRLYADGLKQAGLDQSALGKKWLDAAEKSLKDSTVVVIPYRESGFFGADFPQATSIRFKPKRGQKITVNISIRPASAKVFAELWKLRPGKEPKLIAIADSMMQIEVEQDDDRELILRLQPELLVDVSYSFSVVASPSLAFPVPGNDGTKVGSFWGDARDGGKRSHEGIDIFDKFRTPVIAACDGIVTRVNENKLGGKTIWLNPSDKPYMLYYAHLDSQIATPLQQVNTGDTLGLMGNTGNARNTPTHLHFGIYANGAVDPLPFVQQVSKVPDAIKGDSSLLNMKMRNKAITHLLSSPRKKALVIDTLRPNTLFSIHSVTSSYYRIVLPDGTSGFIPVQEISKPSNPVKTVSTLETTPLLAQADSAAGWVISIPGGTALSAYALFNDYQYIRYQDHSGWIHQVYLQTLKQ